MKIEFKSQKDSQEVSKRGLSKANSNAVQLFIDGILYKEDIPYIPAWNLDHRGEALFHSTSDDFEDFEFINCTQHDIRKISIGYKYLFNPYHVKSEILKRQRKKLNMR